MQKSTKNDDVTASKLQGYEMLNEATRTRSEYTTSEGWRLEIADDVKRTQNGSRRHQDRRTPPSSLGLTQFHGGFVCEATTTEMSWLPRVVVLHVEL
ncbi:hypothetical protein Y032_0454g1732 [Ancylostoma ceylanicum]|uniref:Uncharacterized protein n=1 Tax=Ancylostoma ceylanicum TaxID=53326 RepID=A0A016WYC8_9BILA|nr:hypothetical protein Y032_0454g1732 [Ancylostoma ceylanicum]